jgi:hypothetical protein
VVHSSDVRHAPIAELVPELDRLAVDAMADWKVPGAAIAVVHDGKIAPAKAYGQHDVEAKLPVTAATQSVICSITKTATGVGLLHNEGASTGPGLYVTIFPSFACTIRCRPSGSQYATSHVINPGCRSMARCIPRRSCSLNNIVPIAKNIAPLRFFAIFHREAHHALGEMAQTPYFVSAEIPWA